MELHWNFEFGFAEVTLTVVSVFVVAVSKLKTPGGFRNIYWRIKICTFLPYYSI